MNDNEFFDKLYAKQKLDEAKRLKAAKEKAKIDGKEPFCLDKFNAVYVPSAPPWEAPREKQIRERERYYYLFHAKVMTIVEFARAIELNDLYDGGDMHLE